MKISPAEKIVILENVSENKSKSGIIIAEGAESKRAEIGIIYALGSGKPPIPLKVGDKVVFKRYTDNRVLIEGKEFNFIEFKDVVGVIV